MNKLFVGFIILWGMILSSCNFEEPTNEEVFNELQRTVKDMENYSCEAEITITGNKSPAKYSTRHIFEKPNKYRIEYYDGKQNISYDGNKTYLEYPQVDKSMIIRNSKENEKERSLFIGYFLEVLIGGEEFTLESEKNGEKDYLIISLDLPGGNIYRSSEKLWIDKKNFKPYKMIIYDEDGKESINVYYKNFEYNIKLPKDTLFN